MVVNSSTIPIVASYEDLADAITFADQNPVARWYVIKRAEVFGAEDEIPDEWTGAVDTVTAASIRRRRMPGWQSWLHPRGKDGRFIQKGGMVNVFANPRSGIYDANADRRRAKVDRLTPDGIQLSYQDKYGNPIAADPEAGYSSLIRPGDASKKLSSAPSRVAQLPRGEKVSAEEEFQTGFSDMRDDKGNLVMDAKTGEPKRVEYTPAMTQEQYDSRVQALNGMTKNMEPSRSMAQKGPGRSGEPLPEVNNEEFDAHEKYVAQVTDTGLSIKVAGDAAFKDSYGLWTNEELTKMMHMVEQTHQEVTVGKPQERKAIVLAGLPGAGKTTVLEQLQADGDINGSNWIILDPDNFKAKMWAEGWYPKVNGLSAGETSGFVHAQASEMSAMLEALLVKEGYNLIFDITLSRQEDGRDNGGLTKHLASLVPEYGYDMDGIYVDTTLTKATDSIKDRHRRGLNKLRTRKSFDRNDRQIPNDPELETGGRFVPASVVNGAVSPDPAFSSTSELNFDSMKPVFKRWAEYDGQPIAEKKPAALLKSGKGPHLNPIGLTPGKADMPGWYEWHLPSSPDVPGGEV